MTIKNDKWIRKMAEETNMIEPFEPGQVRMVDGRKVISYGTSSYGYDIRCADEFKIFTNIAPLLCRNSADLCIAQMSPLLKMPLAPTSTTFEYLLLLYHTLVLKAPERQFIFKNVGKLN